MYAKNLPGLQLIAWPIHLQERLFLIVLLAIAALMTAKYFPGLENPSAYAGNVFQAIHPDAFPGDPFIGAERSLLEKSFQISLLYLLVKLGGEIWLDDRFVAVVYLLCVFAAVVGLDHIVRAMGLRDLATRLVVQLVFLRDHQGLTVTFTLAHQPDFNHAALAIPFQIWLIYSALARKPLWVVFLLAALSAAISIKNSPYLIAYCLLVAAVNGSRRERFVIAGVFAAALAVFIAAVVFLVPVPEAERAALFDTIYLRSERGWDANPFFPSPDGWTRAGHNLAFVAVCVAALLVPLPHGPTARALRVFVGSGLAVWLVGGLYFTFAPDFLKLPHIVPFSLVRNLRWPQTVAYITVGAGLFHWLSTLPRPDAKRAGVAVLAIGALFIYGPANHAVWAGAYAVGVAAACVFHMIGLRRSTGRAIGIPEALATTPVPILALGLLLAVVPSFAHTISKRLPAWQVLVHDGVMGDSGAAAWIGVAEYLRAETPPDAVILPLCCDSRYPDELKPKRHVATRSGRSIAIQHELSSVFSLEAWSDEGKQDAVLDRIADSFNRGDWADARLSLRDLALMPDYVIVPEPAASRGPPDSRDFAEAKRIGRFVILKPM